MSRNSLRTILLLAVTLLVWGCTAPLQMYDGERRSMKTSPCSI